MTHAPRRPPGQTPTAAGAAGNPDRFHEAFSQFPGGAYVCAVSDAAGDVVAEMPVGVVPLALEAPRVLLVLHTGSPLTGLLAEQARCSISLLAQGQEDLVRRSAAGQVGGEGTWQHSPTGLPVVDGAACWVECEVTQTVVDGELTLVSANATDVGLAANAHPMLSYQGGYGAFLPGLLSVAPASGPEPARRVAELARGPIEALASELRVECGVFAYEDWHTVSVAVANHSPAARRTRLGYRIPVIPPLGIQFVGSPGSGVTEEEWLARLGTASQTEAALVREQLARVRERGWSLMLDGPLSVHDLDQLVSDYTNPEHTADDEAALLAAIRAMAPYHEPEELLDTELYDVISLSVPVRSPAGETLALLRVHELPRQASGYEVHSWISLLQEAAQSVEQRLADERLTLTTPPPT
ncbi:flavin reductase [Nocardioides sp. zg-536]|uniref:Flavin reductase n=1 Tax=Nocardioides faecalis TaxID=2803858 RepID=A0A939BVU9_9ACTN|nr:flavin reductase family protein [Nocardioides faecalis]MBM9460346.1 flavin reductase [Nocardioides faecalis]QVI59826.1 flavin reductase [Nocardioides faecalis]